MSQSEGVIHWVWSRLNPFVAYAEEVGAIEEDEPEWEHFLAQLRLGGRVLDSAVTWFGGDDLGEDLAIRLLAANLQLDPQLSIDQRVIRSTGMTLASHAAAFTTTYLFNAAITAITAIF